MRDDGDIQFVLANATHDAAMRQLLRENSMDGRIAVSLRREPSYFRAAQIEGTELHAIVALRGGEVVAMGSVSVRERFFNGRVMRMGYLGGLRLAPSCRGRFDILRRGYQFLRNLHAKLKVQFYLTSIAADNHHALQLLEEGLPGMPVYRHVGDLGTALVRVPRNGEFLKTSARARGYLRNLSLQIRHGHAELRGLLLPHLNEAMSRFQFAPFWDEGQLNQQFESQGLRDESFRMIFEDGRIIASVAVWDQRPLKQAVVNAYAGSLAWLRPIYNLWAACTGRVALPRVGVTIPQAFASHLTSPVDRPELVGPLFELLSATAHTIGIKAMTFGLDVRDPRLNWIQCHLRARVYHTRIYMVIWPEDETPIEPADQRLLYPEVALL